MTSRTRAAALAATLTFALAGSAQAATITPVTADSAGATTFGQAVFKDPSLLGATPGFDLSPGAGSAATSDALGLFPTNGTTFGILSTGHADSADDPNANDPDKPADEDFDDLSYDYGVDDPANYVPKRGESDYDVTVLRLPFTARETANCLTLDFQFLSEEYADFVGGKYNDAFIAELDKSTWTTAFGGAITAPDNFAFDQNGNEVSVNAVGVGGFSRANAAQTTYDGATPLLRASKQVTAGAHTLYLSIFDSGDNVADSAAFVDNVRVGFVPNPEQNCKPGAKVANYTLDLSPASATRPVGTQHSVTATLTDDDGNPVANAPVTFTRTGANPGSGTVNTGGDGKATYTYTGTNPGDDAIGATYVVEGTTQATDSATVTWEPATVRCNSAPGVVGCWGFDETSGTTAFDQTPFHNDGTYVGGPQLGVPGVFDKAVSMDGKDDLVRVPDADSLDVGDSFTLEGWVKRDSDTKTIQLFNKGGNGIHLVAMSRYDGNQLWLRKANVVTVARSNGGIPADGQFHHFLVSKDGSDVRMLIDDAVQTVTIGTMKTIENTSFPLYFSATSSGNPVNGDLDEFALYDGAASTPTTLAAKTVKATAAPKSTKSASASETSCAAVGNAVFGITDIKVTGTNCLVARALVILGPLGMKAAGYSCAITGDSFGTSVKVDRDCVAGTKRIRYTTVS